jgi:F-type H+-transporting ATPase subunit gamma
MSSLLEIKAKIESTKSTKKITKAMQLVAASKMKTFQKTSISVHEYTTDLIRRLRYSKATIADTEFAELRETGKTLFILLTSDKGLCGAMNAKLIRTLFRSSDWNSAGADDRLLITIGKKSEEAARVNGVTPHVSYAGLAEQMQVIDALAIIETIIELWSSAEVKRVVLVSPQYVNPFVFHIRVRDYLPLTADTIKQHLSDIEPQEDPIEAAFFEPAREEVIDQMATQVIETILLEAFFQLKATEYSSRMVAMKKATEAADDRIKDLTRDFNKARQDAITRQLSELAAAGEAMNQEHQYELTNV